MWEFMGTKLKTHQKFETADYLALHLPWNHKIFTKDVFMYAIYWLKLLERDSKTCVLETQLFITNKSNGMPPHIPQDLRDRLF